MKTKTLSAYEDPDDLTETAELAASSDLPVAPENLRQLAWNEVVYRGDFIANERNGFELWDGPSGFQADSFLKPIFRRANKKTA